MPAPARPFFAGLACSLALIALAQPAPADPPQSTAPATAEPAVALGPPADEGAEKHPRLVTPRLARAAVRAALTASRQAEAWGRLSSLETRARTSAWMPDLALRVARNTDESLRLSPTIDEPYHYTSAGGVGWWIEARLTWHFDRLVFDTHELGVERLRLEHAERAGKLVTKVISTLFGWQRASLKAEDPTATPEEQERAELERAEAEILLDLLTGGWFVRELARRHTNE
jgi:hypothetical protein